MISSVIVLLILVSCINADDISKENKPKIVIDNDAGGDDAMAIFLVLLYEKYFDGPELIALTTGNGNTVEDNVSLNNQRILHVAKRQDVPIYRGSKKSIVVTPDAGAYYGEDGLGDSGEIPDDLIPPKEKNAVLKLIELSKKYEGELTVITIGTLTNVALATSVDPDFLKRIAHLYIGAGHIHGGKHTDPEFNADMDVEAYRVVVEHATPDKVTVLPFSQIQYSLNFSRTWRESVLGAIPTDIMRAQNIYERISLPKSDRWQALDPATVAAVIKPELVEEYKYSKNDIIRCGDRRGINTNSFGDKEKANIRIIYSMKKEEYEKFLLDVFSADVGNETKK